jgi:lipopolysaccharide transport system permease protein
MLPLVDPCRTLWKDRFLVARLARRDIHARWRGSALGPLWAVGVPLALLGVYTFVFSTVLGGRWDSAGSEAAPPFALVLFAGLVVFQIFAETVQPAAGLIRANAVLVKQVVFPLEILPAVGLVVALFHAAMSMVVFAAVYLLLVGVPPARVAMLPLAMLPIPFLAVGVAWFVAGLGAYLRDTMQIVPVLVMMVMFLCPVFYPVEAVPEGWRFVVLANPLSVSVGAARAALFDAPMPSIGEWVVAFALALAVFDLGFRFFRRVRTGFADVV